jgi:hypothetical protein
MVLLIGHGLPILTEQGRLTKTIPLLLLAKKVDPFLLHVLLEFHKALKAQLDELFGFLRFETKFANELILQLELIPTVFIGLHENAVRDVAPAVVSKSQYSKLHGKQGRCEALSLNHFTFLSLIQPP